VVQAPGLIKDLTLGTDFAIIQFSLHPSFNHFFRLSLQTLEQWQVHKCSLGDTQLTYMVAWLIFYS
jgi:hypothetical protein